MTPTSVHVERATDAILLASYGTFSTGINVRRLHHVVLASPSKSRYRVLQSIGRGLRLHASKRVVYVHDLVDDLHSREYTNHVYKHWRTRAKFYKEEQFPLELFAHDFNAPGFL